MDMSSILTILLEIVCGVIALFSLIYLCLILFIQRFHHSNNMFILNICINIIFCSIYFAIFFQMAYSYIPPSTCIIFQYCFHIASIGIPLAFSIFTVHRFCSLLYHTVYFFKKKRWVVLCITSQWILQILLSLPFVGKKNSVSFFF